MVEIRRRETGRVFTIELNTGSDLKRVSIPNGPQRLLLEGTIGSLKHAKFVEDAVLELEGTGGTLRVDLSIGDIARPSLAKSTGEGN
jgi:hypothetical protein